MSPCPEIGHEPSTPPSVSNFRTRDSLGALGEGAGDVYRKIEPARSYAIDAPPE